MNSENRKEPQRMGNDGSTAKKSQKKEHRRDRSPRSTDGSTSKPPEPRRTRTPRTQTTVNKGVRGSGGPTNPFLIFFLRVRSKKPNEPVTVIARKAGKAWAKMTPSERQKYVDLANAAKKRRQGRPRKKEPKNKDSDKEQPK